MSQIVQTLPDRPCRTGGVLLIGINPSPVSVAAGHYYRGVHGRRLWKRLGRLGLLAGAAEGREDDAFVAAGNGLTDLVKRPTPRASDLRAEELVAGASELRSKIRKWKPLLILFAYRPPADFLLETSPVGPGRCADFDGVPTFLLSSPYASSSLTVQVDGELQSLIRNLSSARRGHRHLPKAPVATVAPPSTAGQARAKAAGAKAALTQPVTVVDLKYKRIRLPKRSKAIFPRKREIVCVDLRGVQVDARYDPRRGPDRERSAVLSLRREIRGLVAPGEVLRLTRSKAGVVQLR